MTADHQFSQVLVPDDFAKPSSSYRTQAWLATPQRWAASPKISTIYTRRVFTKKSLNGAI